MHFTHKKKTITVCDWLVIPCDRLHVYARQYTVELFTASTAEKNKPFVAEDANAT